MVKKFDDVDISQGMIDLDELNFTKNAQEALKKIKDAKEKKKNAYDEALKSDPLLLAEQRMLLNQQMDDN